MVSCNRHITLRHENFRESLSTIIIVFAAQKENLLLSELVILPFLDACTEVMRQEMQHGLNSLLYYSRTAHFCVNYSQVRLHLSGQHSDRMWWLDFLQIIYIKYTFQENQTKISVPLCAEKKMQLLGFLLLFCGLFLCHFCVGFCSLQTQLRLSAAE